MSERSAAELFPSLLGDAFGNLPQVVRTLHQVDLPRRFEGRAQVQVPTSLCARLIARCTGLPLQGGDVPVAVTITGQGAGQRWTRDFPPRPMVSNLSPYRGLLRERLGPATLDFRLEATELGLTWRLAGVRFLGVPLPLGVFSEIRAHESERDGRYFFSVRAALPGIGHLIGYEGWLDVGRN